MLLKVENEAYLYVKELFKSEHLRPVALRPFRANQCKKSEGKLIIQSLHPFTCHLVQLDMPE